MIRYHNREYPLDIPTRIEEIAANFDVKKIILNQDYSLHTEYSYGIRTFNGQLINKFREIVSSNKCGIPQLWKSELWALEFADFIAEFVGNANPPKIIEIHPPFNDYADMDFFALIYSIFESKIKDIFPNVEIYLENRCGSLYKGGKFLISKINDIKEMCRQIELKHLSLRIAFDIPQIYTAHHAKSGREYTYLLESIKELRGYIGCVHLWGKKLYANGEKTSHCGDLNSYFGCKSDKLAFLESFTECFNDSVVRKMVLEVNSGDDDLLSIIKDLRTFGINFI